MWPAGSRENQVYTRIDNGFSDKGSRYGLGIRTQVGGHKLHLILSKVMSVMAQLKKQTVVSDNMFQFS